MIWLLIYRMSQEIDRDGYRLRHNVIKTGVRMISLSYSRISLKDICLKLQLDSEEDAEYIVAKVGLKRNLR